MKQNFSLSHYNHNHDKLGRFSSSPGSSGSSSGLVKRAKSRRAEKLKVKQEREKQKTKKEKEKHDANRDKVIKSGSAKEVEKYLGELSNDELQNIITRLNREKKIRELSAEENKSVIDSAIPYIEKYSKYGETVANAINTTNKIINALDGGSSSNQNKKQNNQSTIESDKKSKKKKKDKKK